MTKCRLLKVLLYGFLPVIGVIIILTGVMIIPKGVSYTVKDAVSEQRSNETKILSDSNKIRKPEEYTVKLIDGKICVLCAGDVMYEISLNLSDLTDYDKQRLIKGIIVTTEAELIGLTEKLKS